MHTSRERAVLEVKMAPYELEVSLRDTVLVVDDDPAIREGIADILTVSGYSVIAADDGVTALQELQFQTPDLIISDIMMREMDGYEFFATIRSNPRWLTIPFIFLSARTEDKDIQYGHQMGVDAYLAKPFAPDNLVVLVENKLRRAREIKEYARSDVELMKQQLLTTFSHELRTPLTYISGYLSLLEESTDLDRNSANDMLLGMRRGTDRLTRLVADLTLMARIDGGVVQAEIIHRRSSMLLKPIAQTILDKYEKGAAAENVRLTLEVFEEVSASCIAYYVEDIVDRLVSNGIKFSGKDGGEVICRIERNGHYASISVTDHGIGIRPEEHHAIFEKFQQLDREDMEQQGVGIGLTIARSLAQAHGGNIVVKSVPGEGSTFSLLLPLQDRLPGS